MRSSRRRSGLRVAFEVNSALRHPCMVNGKCGRDHWTTTAILRRTVPAAPADERTGRNAILKADEAGWDEGLKEARACTRSAGGDSSNCKSSRYGNFAIFGNLILICQGRDEGSGAEACTELLAQLQPPG
ncbi:MAG: hypothetical protein IIB90_18190 [Gemmatimonadetes bacterium]|nr:hypothetical protein [Gemmatimonadota bacterium]